MASAVSRTARRSSRTPSAATFLASVPPWNSAVPEIFFTPWSSIAAATAPVSVKSVSARDPGANRSAYFNPKPLIRSKASY